MLSSMVWLALLGDHQALRERQLGNNNNKNNKVRVELERWWWTQTRWLKPTGICMFKTGLLGPRRSTSVPLTPTPDSTSPMLPRQDFPSIILWSSLSQSWSVSLICYAFSLYGWLSLLFMVPLLFIRPRCFIPWSCDDRFTVSFWILLEDASTQRVPESLQVGGTGLCSKLLSPLGFWSPSTLAPSGLELLVHIFSSSVKKELVLVIIMLYWTLNFLFYTVRLSFILSVHLVSRQDPTGEPSWGWGRQEGHRGWMDIRVTSCPDLGHSTLMYLCMT